MKSIVGVLLIALLAANLWSLLNQRRIERRLDALHAENQKLADEIAQKPALSPEDFRTAQAQLERAHSYMDAVDDRLTNAAALLKSLQDAAMAQNQVATTRYPSVRPRHIPPGNAFPGGNPGDHPASESTAELLGPPSSSHSADGQLLHRSWGPEQVLGPPDTQEAGDIPTAWAPKSSNGAGEEWLHVNYDRAVDIAEINVRETHNPGAISKITALLPTGQEIVLWEGIEPPAQPPVNMKFTVPPGVRAQSVKVYLDRQRVPGWNEIDAVELVGGDGSRQWASSATASSSFAEP